MSLLRNLFVPKREVAVKLPSHKLGSTGTLALYGVIMGGEGSVDVTVSLVEVGLRVSSLETHGGLEGSNVKLYIGRFDRRRYEILLSQTLFGHISTNSLTIFTVLMATGSS